MKKVSAVFVLLLILALSALVSIVFGGSRLGLEQVFYGLMHPFAPGSISTIIWRIRLPRILLGIVIGAGLSSSGCAFQGMLRNPLADPYTLGISGGAAFGVAVAIILDLARTSVFFVPLFAFAGAAASVVIVYAVSVRKGFSTHTLILTGVIIGFIFSSLVLLLYAVSSPAKIQHAIIWLMGDLSSTDTGMLSAAAVYVALGLAVLFAFARELDILTMGEEKAVQLGVKVESAKKVIFAAASFVTATCVASSGVIGFVGLIIPHFMRRLYGPGHRFLLAASAIGGAVFLVLCDAAARTVMAPVELPVGVITGFVGGIVFLFYLAGSQKHEVF